MNIGFGQAHIQIWRSLLSEDTSLAQLHVSLPSKARAQLRQLGYMEETNERTYLDL